MTRVQVPQPESAPHTVRRQRAALVAVLLAPFMALVDMFIVNIAAPSIERQLHASFAAVQLVIGGYIVAFAMGLVTGGRLGDMLGRRRVFVAGLVCFAVTSAGCAVAASAGELFVMRLFQGLAAALMLPQVLALIQVLFSQNRGRILGLYGATQSCGSISGQLLGGLFIRFNVAGLGWRTIFLVNIPLCLVAVVCALAAIPRGETRARRVRFDPLGVLLLSSAVALLLGPLVFGAQDGWPVAVWPALAGSVLLFGLFAWWESKLPAAGNVALFPIRLLRLPGFANGLPTAVAFYCGNAGFYLVLAFYLQDGIRLSPLWAAAEFVPLGTAFAVSSLASRRLVARFGNAILRCGAAIIILGLLVIYLSIGGGSESAQGLALEPGLLLCGIGQGLVLPCLLGVVLESVDAADAGSASGGVLTASQIAGALGVAGVGAVFGSALTGHTYETAFGTSILALGALGLVSLIMLARLTAKVAGERSS